MIPEAPQSYPNLYDSVTVTLDTSWVISAYMVPNSCSSSWLLSIRLLGQRSKLYELKFYDFTNFVKELVKYGGEILVTYLWDTLYCNNMKTGTIIPVNNESYVQWLNSCCYIWNKHFEIHSGRTLVVDRSLAGGRDSKMSYYVLGLSIFTSIWQFTIISIILLS